MRCIVRGCEKKHSSIMKKKDQGLKDLKILLFVFRNDEIGLQKSIIPLAP